MYSMGHDFRVAGRYIDRLFIIDDCGGWIYLEVASNLVGLTSLVCLLTGVYTVHTEVLAVVMAAAAAAAATVVATFFSSFQDNVQQVFSAT